MKIPVVARLCWGALLLWLAGFPVAYGQQYSISTVAGGAPPATPATATSTGVGVTRRVTFDPAGNLYFTAGECVFKLSGTNVVLVAGTGRPGFSGDGGPAVSAQLNTPVGLAFDQKGNLFVADSLNNRIRVIDPTGVINTYAGNGQIGVIGYFGDGGPATEAQLNNPLGVAVDSFGQVHVADTGNNLIRKITLSGIISTIAGNGLAAYAGDHFLAVNAELNHPADLVFDSAYNLLIADTGNALIRRITAADGDINIFAGNITEVGYYGDGRYAADVGFAEPYSIAMDAAGDLWVAERGDGRIRLVLELTAQVTTVAGTGALGFFGDNGPANQAMLNQPTGIAVDSSGNLYIADSQNCRIRKALAGGNANPIATIVGNGVISYSGDGGQATKAQLNTAMGVAVDSSGNLYIADTSNNVVRKVTASGAISTLAGTGSAGFSGDGSAAAGAQLNAPRSVAVDSSGNVYIADTGNSRVRKISAAGVISTYAGSGTVGYAGDNAAATSAQLNAPLGLAVDSAGNLYIADFGNNVVRKVSAGGAISTVAGNGIQGYGGDGGKATGAALNGPQAVVVDTSGDLYIADSQNSRIRVVTPDGAISTVAGTGIAGYTGDGHPAINAQIANPAGLAVDSAGSLYITDSSTLVRKFFVGGPIVTIAGNGTVGYSGDGGAATLAQLDAPIGLAVNSQGIVYIADSGNSAIRSLQATTASISLAAVVSAASGQSGSVAPGEVLVLYGANLGPAGAAVSTTFNSNGLLPTSVAGTTVYFNGTPGPILYASANQVSAIVPFGVTGSYVQMYVAYQNQTSAPITVSLAPAAPAFFTVNYSGTGQAVAVNISDNSLNGTAHPAAAGSYVILYATGLGQTNPPGVNGSQVVGPPLPLPLIQPTATIGGKPAVVQYAGGGVGLLSGVSQIDLLVPSGLTPGANAVVLTSGGVSSPAGVTIVVGN